MAEKIKGNRDREGGGNDTYRIQGRGSKIPRKTIIKEVKNGQHPNHEVIKVNGEEFIRSKPDCSKTNNVNED